MLQRQRPPAVVQVRVGDFGAHHEHGIGRFQRGLYCRRHHRVAGAEGMAGGQHPLRIAGEQHRCVERSRDCGQLTTRAEASAAGNNQGVARSGEQCGGLLHERRLGCRPRGCGRHLLERCDPLR